MAGRGQRATTLRLSDEGRRLLELIAESYGDIPLVAVVEVLVRQEAERLGIEATGD